MPGFVRPPISSALDAPPVHQTVFEQRLSQITEPERRSKLQALLAQDSVRSMLGAIRAGSSYLASIIDTYPEMLLALDEPATLLSDLQRELDKQPIGHRLSLLRKLREIKRKTACVVGLGDLVNQLEPVEAMRALSELADSAVQKLTEHLLLAASHRGEIALFDPERPTLNSGLIVLGMGKLGAFELNYSSDIDLIVLFDPQQTGARACANPMALAVQLARTMTYLLEQKTDDGYIFRTDLRLRPNLPGHPLALSTDDAEIYYERHGQNWERAAHIKARPIAGDLAAGDAYLERLSPFLWRKHLDYAAIKDIQSIKRQINVHHGFGSVDVKGHDLKVGRGGIREIEFFCQTQQLILGGQHSELRNAGTCASLRLLGSTRWIEPAVADDLIEAYQDLRDLEHRLQMIADKQTHRVPSNEVDFARFAHFCGYGDITAFEAGIRDILRRVEARYAALFEHAPALGGAGRLVFTGTGDDPGTLETLAGMGFEQPSAVSSAIRSWHHGHIRAMRSSRARELLTELTPSILVSFEGQQDKDRAFRLFDDLVRNLPSGVQLFSLFHANPRLLQLVSDLIGAAPKLVGLLSASTDLFEAMLTPDFFDPLPGYGDLAAEHAARTEDARDLQDVFDISRQWAHARQFQAGLQLFLGIADIRDAAGSLTAIAELMVQRMLAEASRWLEAHHGAIADGRFVVLALGKLGSRELSIGSDLDLVFVYDAQEGALSDGAKPLPAQTYFARLGQRLMTALSARTAEGRLFEIDTRLRPSGNAGPVACSLGNFERYQVQTAETWEQQSLTRARAIAGDPDLAAQTMTVVDAVIARPRDPANLAHDVRSMRCRIFKAHGSDDPWNLKHVRGGLVEVEFIAQFLQLGFSHSYPALRSSATRPVFEEASACGILTAEQGTLLIGALDLLHALSGVLRLSLIDKHNTKTASKGLGKALVRAASRALPRHQIDNLGDLEARLIETERHIGQIFDQYCPDTKTED